MTNFVTKIRLKLSLPQHAVKNALFKAQIYYWVTAYENSNLIPGSRCVDGRLRG